MYQLFEIYENDSGEGALYCKLNITLDEVCHNLRWNFYDYVLESEPINNKLNNKQPITVEDVKEIISNRYNDDYYTVNFNVFKCIDSKLIEVPFEDLINNVSNELLKEYEVKEVFPKTITSIIYE